MLRPAGWVGVESCWYNSTGLISWLAEGEAFVKKNPGLIDKSRHECFAPTIENPKLRVQVKLAEQMYDLTN